MSDTSEAVQTPSFMRHLLAEAAQGDRQATEALFCSFGVNLAFFESQILGPSRTTGAAVTILSDAHAFPIDVRSMQAAGISYIPAVAALTGAFHPKVNIVAGPQRALISIGSGNLTVDGWHNNDELCTVLTADRTQGCPTVVSELAQWLEALPSAIPAIGPAGKDALRRVSAVLRDLAAEAPAIDTGHRLVTSNSTAILDQLPQGTVDTLDLYAPFHDLGGRALHRLIERYHPQTIAIALQTGAPYRTVIDPALLNTVATNAGVNVTFHVSASDRYRHGKLIQATMPSGESWTLTGSANLSAGALLKSIAGGGNCEVGLVTILPAPTLFPPAVGAPVAAENLQKLTLFAPGEARPTREAVILLAAEITTRGILVHLDRPAPFAVTVEISRFKDQPDERTALGAIPEGATSGVFTGDFPGGSRLRLTWQDVHGTQTVSASEKPLIDPVRARRRIARGTLNTHSPAEPSQFFDDPKTAAAWLNAVQQMAAQRASARAVPTVGVNPSPTRTPSLSPEKGWRTLDDPDAWQQYQEDAVARLGQSMLIFALGGLPNMANLTVPSHAGSTPDWVDRPEQDDPTAEEGATVEAVAENASDADEDTSGPTRADPLTRKRTAQERRRVRNWLASVVNAMADVPAIDRFAMHSIVLLAIQARFWESDMDEGGWFDLLAAGTLRLDGDDVPAELQGRLAALIATATFLLDECLTPGLTTQHSATYYGVLEKVGYRLIDLDDDLLAQTLVALKAPGGFPIDPFAVREHVDLITQPDPDRSLEVDAKKAIEGLDEIIRIRPGVWEARGDFANPQRVAARIVDLAPDQPLFVVCAHGLRGRWSLMLRQGDTLTSVDHPYTFTRFRDYRLSPLVTASGIAQSSDMESNHRVRSLRITIPSPFAEAAFRDCGVQFGVEGPILTD